MMRASPWPPPPQSAAAPVPPPRRRSSRARVGAVAAELGEPGQSELPGAVLAHDHGGAAAVGELRRGPRGDRSVGAERGLQRGEPSGRGAWPYSLVVLHQHVALAAGHGDPDDFGGQPAGLDRRRGSGVRFGREDVLVLAGDAQAGLVALGGRAHRDAVDPAHQAVPVQGIGQRRLPATQALPGAREQVRSVRHGFHAARHDDVVPMMTAPTWFPVMPARSSAAAIAVPASAGAGRVDREPSSLPTGVRAPATSTGCDMDVSSSAIDGQGQARAILATARRAIAARCASDGPS